jgi:hypothetical protein
LGNLVEQYTNEGLFYSALDCHIEFKEHATTFHPPPNPDYRIPLAQWKERKDKITKAISKQQGMIDEDLFSQLLYCKITSSSSS